MSEKRYYVSCAGYLCDNDLSNTLSIFECADLLNQLTKENERLQKENNILNMNEDDLKECILENIQLKEENEKLRNELNDCDFILLQDDFGNYEIRYDNDKIFHFLWEVAPILNKQQAIIQSLKEEIKKLNEELYYCEKFRYQVFQRLNELNED